MSMLDDVIRQLIDSVVPDDSKGYALLYTDAMALATAVFSLRSKFGESDIDIKSDLSRLAVAVPSNILNSVTALTYDEQLVLLQDASSTLIELKTLLMICVGSNLIDMDTLKDINEVADKVDSALSSAIGKLDEIVNTSDDE